MINITNTNWRPFIELTAISNDDAKDSGTFYFDVTRRPLIVQDKDCTVLEFEEGTITVKETVNEIIEAVDEMISREQDKKAQQAREYMQATLSHVNETKEKLEK